MIVGVDLGGTKVAAGLVRGGRILRSCRLLTGKERGKAHVVARIREAVETAAGGARITGVGIGVPGYFNGSRVSMLPNLHALDGADLGKALPWRVRLTNDAKAFALGEARYGTGKGKRLVVALTLGTGLGSGVVLDGKIFSGSRGAASHRGEGGVPELGHLIFDVEQERYAEGQHRGDWESLLCGPAIVARHRARGGGEGRASEIWSSRSRAARKTQAEAARHLAILCANIVRMYGPDAIVLGGGVATAGMVRDANRLLPSYGCKPIVRLSRLKERAAILGAASLF